MSIERYLKLSEDECGRSGSEILARYLGSESGSARVLTTNQERRTAGPPWLRWPRRPQADMRFSHCGFSARAAPLVATNAPLHH